MRELVYIDTETHRFAPGNMAPAIVCLTWSAGEHCGIVLKHEVEAWLEPVLDAAIAGEVVIAGHQISYDFGCVLEHYPRLRDKVWRAYGANAVTCTKIREKLLDIAAGWLRGRHDDANNVWEVREYSLTDLTHRYLGKKLDKGEDGWRLRYDELDGVPLDQWPDRARAYAMDDAVEGARVFRLQDERCVDMRYLLPTQFEETKADLGLRLASAHGIYADGPRTMRLAEHIIQKMDELREVLFQNELVRRKYKTKRPDLFSKDTKAIRNLVVETWDVGMHGPVPLTKTGKVQTGKDVLEQCEHPALWAMVEYASLEKQGSAFVSKLLDGVEVPIHARFEVLGAGTSRTSCRQPNLQQQPRMPGVRECFVARDGTVFLACDYDTQEMRTLAQSTLDLLDCECKLAKRFQEDPHFDPHLEFAASSRGIQMSYAQALMAAGDKMMEEARQHAKIANFGLPGGMGVRGLIRYAKGYGVTMDYEEAETLRNGWFLQWPEMVDYFKRISAMTAYTDECDVVIPQSGFRRGAVGYTNAANTYFQGLAAHASKAALFEASRRCYNDRDSYLYGSRPVNFVHDEIVLETPEYAAHEAAKELECLMVEQMARYTPDIPVAATAALMRNWSKKAKPVHDSDGRLVVWEEA